MIRHNMQTNLVRLAYGSTLMDSGYTLWNDESTKYKGFVVGGMTHESECEIDDGLGFRTLFDSYLSMAKTFKQNSGEYDNPSVGIGTWVEDIYQDRIENSTRRVYFDIVQHVENEQDAVDMCIERGEKAYFDILNQKSIYITTEDDAVDMLYGVDNNQ